MKSKTGYVLLDYRFEFEDYDKKEYDSDPDEPLTLEDLILFKNELEYLKEKGFNIHSIEHDYGAVVLKTDEDMDKIGFREIDPEITQCSKDGYSCEWCLNHCKEWNTCEFKEPYYTEEFDENKAIREYIDNLEEDSVLKIFFGERKD